MPPRIRIQKISHNRDPRADPDPQHCYTHYTQYTVQLGESAESSKVGDISRNAESMLKESRETVSLKAAWRADRSFAKRWIIPSAPSSSGKGL